jgi:hypothetical protein
VSITADTREQTHKRAYIGVQNEFRDDGVAGLVLAGERQDLNVFHTMGRRHKRVEGQEGGNLRVHKLGADYYNCKTSAMGVSEVCKALAIKRTRTGSHRAHEGLSHARHVACFFVGTTRVV